MDPWENPEHHSYHGEKKHRCLGCGKPCAKSSWGRWCFPCNFARMSRIDKQMKELAKSIGHPYGDENPTS